MRVFSSAKKVADDIYELYTSTDSETARQRSSQLIQSLIDQYTVEAYKQCIADFGQRFRILEHDLRRMISSAGKGEKN
jgi:ribosomal 50S subunit-associated protein YjgA (DUF615 family)